MSFLDVYRKGVVFVDWALSHLYVRKFEVFGRENIPLDGPLILTSNHLNNADPPMIILAVQPRHPTFMAKQEMINWPVAGLLLKYYGAFPVRRGEADRAALKAACEIVEGGAMLVMFPEGTRSRTGGMTKGHPGSGLVALRTGALVLPVAITGSEGIGWPWIFFKPFSIKHITITIGESFHLPPVERINSESTAQATDIIMRRIAALLPPNYRGVYADTDVEREPAPAKA